jgi:hypothetical protein
MMDFTQYGTLPHDYGFGAQKGGGSGGGTSTDPALTLSVIEQIERLQNVYTTKKWSAAWQTPVGTAARRTADAAYQAASRDLVLVRVVRDRVRRKVLVRVSELPPAVAQRYAAELPRAGKGTGGGTGGGKGKGGKGGGGGRGVGWEAALAAQAGAAGAAPADVQADAAAAGTGTGEIIAGVSNTTLLLLGGGALLAFVLVRRKGNKAASVFKGI